MRGAAAEPASDDRPANDATAAAPEPEDLTPLEYMLRVMNDPSADIARRDRMAQAAAAYVHGRGAAAAPIGKRVLTRQAAHAAATGKYAPPPPPPKLVVNNS